MLIRSIFWYFCFCMTLLAHTPRMFWVKQRRKKMSQHEFSEYIHKIASRWAKGNALRTGAKFNFEGMENLPEDNQPAVYIANHQGDFDIAVFLAFFPAPHGYVAKIEMLKVPLLRTWMKHMRCIFIDRKNLRQTAGAIMEGIKILKSGHSLVLFPEGTRSKSPQMGEFKAASFKLATKATVPIVPVTIDGTYKIMEANNRKIAPAHVNITIHAPIPTAGLSPDELAELPERVKEIIGEKLPQTADFS